MGAIIGIVIVFVMVFGGYILAGGKMDIILKALPFEMMIIGGGAAGALIIGNKGSIAKGVGKSLKLVFKGSNWKSDDYKELLLLLYGLCRVMKTKGLVALEQHIEKPQESKVFAPYKSVLGNHFAIELICDTLRTMTMGMENPMELEEIITKRIESHHQEAHEPAHALQTTADALPAIGIVAAVMGVIKTMGSINEPPEILGKMIGGALVGTFLGVFLAYCFVGPFANKAMQVLDEDQQYYFIIRDVLVAHLKGMAPQVSMEIGRISVPLHHQPSFEALENASADVKIDL